MKRKDEQERQENVKLDEYKAVIVFADGETKAFKVPVLKYWELTDKYLIEHNLFPLLPLQIFLLRAELDKLTKNNNNQAKQAAILKARDIAERIAKESAELNKTGRLTDDDYKKVLSAIANLFIHLNNRYKVNENLNEGVRTVLVELDFSDANKRRIAIDRGKREKAVEMAKKMLLNNEPIEKIKDYTGLTKKELNEIQKTL